MKLPASVKENVIIVKTILTIIYLTWMRSTQMYFKEEKLEVCLLFPSYNLNLVDKDDFEKLRAGNKDWFKSYS